MSLLFVPFGLYTEPRIRAITIPAIIFVLIYSFLPHKELRFIIYVFPMFNIASACACQRLWNNRNKSFLQTVLSVIAAGHLLGNFVLTVFLLNVSKTNYPGGIAISKIHRIAPSDQNVTIHIDNLTAQSGVTRFTEIYANWTYSKDEHLKAGDEELHKFDYLLTEVKNKYAPEMRLLQQTHEKIELIECFSNIGVHYASLVPIRIRTKPCIIIMKRKENPVLLKRYFEVPEEFEDLEIEIESQEGALENDMTETVSEEVIHTEELVEEKPKVLKKKRLRSTINKLKMKEIIEAGKIEDSKKDDESVQSVEQEILADIEQSDVTSEELWPNDVEIINDLDEKKSTESGSGSIKSNIKKIISQEKTKQLLEEFKKIDLSALCDLTQMDTKECLKKILDEQE